MIQPIIDACLKLRQEHATGRRSGSRVAIQASPGAMALCNNRNPQDEMQAHVSLHHWTAAALIRGTARIKELQDRTVQDRAISAFQDRIEVVGD